MSSARRVRPSVVPCEKAIGNMTASAASTRRRLQLESILDDLNGAVSVFDHRGRLTYFNEAEREMFDFGPDEVWIGQQMRDFVSRKRRLSSRAKLRMMIA